MHPPALEDASGRMMFNSQGVYYNPYEDSWNKGLIPGVVARI